MMEHSKAEEVARVTRRIFEEALEKVRGVAAEQVAANENAARAATDALNAQKDLAQHDALLSQARQSFDALNQKYITLQAEILRKAASCTQRSTGAENPQGGGGTSTPCPPTTPCPPPHLAGVAPAPVPAGVVPMSANLIPKAALSVPANLVPKAAVHVPASLVPQAAYKPAPQRIAVPFIPASNAQEAIQKVGNPAVEDSSYSNIGEGE